VVGGGADDIAWDRVQGQLRQEIERGAFRAARQQHQYGSTGRNSWISFRNPLDDAGPEIPGQVAEREAKAVGELHQRDGPPSLSHGTPSLDFETAQRIALMEEGRRERLL
jgi:hypothetical protein